MASTEESKHRAEEMHQHIADRLAGTYQNNSRIGLFAAFISTTMTHHEAILILLNHERLIGFAFAFFRPLVDAGFRGMFTGFSATDEQVEQIAKGGKPYPHFNDLWKISTRFSKPMVFSADTAEKLGRHCAALRIPDWSN